MGEHTMEFLHFPENITRLRQAQGLTQEVLADHIGVTKASVSKWERGQSLPDAPVLAELVYAAGEAQGMSREEYDAALEAMGMTVEEYISTIFSAVDMGELLTLMLGSDAGTESAGWCKAVDGQLMVPSLFSV